VGKKSEQIQGKYFSAVDNTLDETSDVEILQKDTDRGNVIISLFRQKLQNMLLAKGASRAALDNLSHLLDLTKLVNEFLTGLPIFGRAHTGFWPKFQLLNKISIFDQIFRFSKKFRFWAKISIFLNSSILTKISIFDQISYYYFRPKFRFLKNISIFDQNLDV